MFVTLRVAIGAPLNADRIAFMLDDGSPGTGVLFTFDSVEGQLGELHLDIVVVRAPDAGGLAVQSRRAAEIAAKRGATAVFWFTPLSDGSLRVVALHAPSGRVFARDVHLAANAAEQREQLAIVLRAAVPAVLAGGDELGRPLLVVRSESPTPEPQAPPAAAAESPIGPPPPAPIRLRAALGYAGSLVAPSHWQSAISAALIGTLHPWLQAAVQAEYAPPITLQSDGADARIARVALAATLGAARSFAPANVAFEIGAVSEAWHRSTQLHSDVLQSTAPSTTWRFGCVALTRVELRIAGGVDLYLTGGVDWLPVAHALAIQSASAERQLPTSGMRLRAGAGVALDLFAKSDAGHAKIPTRAEANGH